MQLSELKTGESAIIIKVLGHGGFRRRILEMGFVRGQRVTAILNAPLKDPIKYNVMDYEVSLRRSEAQMIEIEPYCEERSPMEEENRQPGISSKIESQSNNTEDIISERCKEINVALVGNPNSGKTSLFNALSGGHEHVGNYSGVTVDAKVGHFKYRGYKFNITDLPGTYALTAYSPEERYVREYLLKNTPDIILNAVVTSNLERNLYLTTELIDINLKSVVALNMYDEHEKSGAELDYTSLAKLTGVPMIPVVAKEKRGLEELTDTIIDLYENGTTSYASTNVNEIVRHIHIKYTPAIEREIDQISKYIKKSGDLFPNTFPPRYWSLKLLEKDAEVEKHIPDGEEKSKLVAMRNSAVERIRKELGEDVESAVTDEKYGFISGALKEVYKPGSSEQNKNTTIIDAVVTNKVLGFPLFLLLLWLMFHATFSLGAYPQEWIESLVGVISRGVSGVMSDGVLKDLLVDGIIGGVGSVIVFLPNIMILYLFISLMEDSGYMARAAFIMDKLMHKIGLHGKSFIPLIMGFGCNVPAIMSARTIESRSSRLITILINPFISCSARLPVYILMAGIFFPHSSGNVLMFLYLIGIVMAIITARILRRFLFKKDDTPFVMELPPYRVPTLNATMTHMWDKCAQYLKKIGSIILFASIIIWFLGYYPRPHAQSQENPEAYNGSYLEQIGKACEPVIEPLGMNWKAGVALLSGAAAKEIIVSTFGVLYSDETEIVEGEGEEEKMLKNAMVKSGDFTPASAISFMIFVLLYFPCIATLAAIANETGSWKWALFSFIYSCLVAWCVSFIFYRIALLF